MFYRDAIGEKGNGGNYGHGGWYRDEIYSRVRRRRWMAKGGLSSSHPLVFRRPLPMLRYVTAILNDGDDGVQFRRREPPRGHLNRKIRFSSARVAQRRH